MDDNTASRMTNLKIGDTSFDINQSLFHNNTVGHLVWNQKDCINVDGDTPVERALELMVMRGISSLPVKNKDGQWTGILNMADIVAHMVGYVPGPSSDDSTTRDDGQKHRHIEGKLQEKEALKIPCSQLLGLTWESRHLVVFDAADRIDSAILRLSQGNHRGLVQGKGWWQVLSQWDIAVWLARHCREIDDPNLADNRKEWLGTCVNATLGELKMAESKHVVTIPHDMSAIEAFRRLASNGVSAMPIVAANGTLCGTVSISDLRGMDFAKWKALELPVMEFLKVANLLQYPQNAQVVANSHTKFGDLLLKIQARDVHRVWLISGDNKPTGVVSLSDLLHRLHELLNPEPKMLESDDSMKAKMKQSSPAIASPLMSSRTGTETSKGMSDKDKCKCTATSSSFQKSTTGDKATTGGNQCNFGNTSCNCPTSCACGGSQASQQSMAECHGSTSGATAAQKKSQTFGHDQQQQQQAQQHQSGKMTGSH
jgi:CBS domain-containing protein